MTYPGTPIHRLPEGFVKVSVVLTAKEAARFRSAAAWQPHGTYSEAIRVALGLGSSPYGLIAALRRQSQTENEN